MQRSKFVVDLKRLESLPTLPVMAVNLLNLSLDEDSSTADLAGLIAADPALTLKLLKVANSPFYRREREVTELQDAIVLLGRKSFQTLVLSLTVFDLFDKDGHLGGLDYDR